MKKMMHLEEFKDQVLDAEVMGDYKDLEHYAEYNNIGGITTTLANLEVHDTQGRDKVTIRLYEIKLWDEENQEVVTAEFGMMHDDTGTWLCVCHFKIK